MKALGQNLIVLPIIDANKHESSLLLPDSKQKYLIGTSMCDDESIGVEIGNVIYYQPSGFMEIEVSEVKYHSVSYSSLIIRPTSI